jgi:uncharacterized protein
LVIKPIEKDIQQGSFNQNPERAINDQMLQKWLGFAFERFCRRHHPLIAKQLGFAAVRYRSGAYFSRSTINEEPGFQIDLLFERDDHVMTVCEMKYLRGPVSSTVMTEFERKLQLLPNINKKTIQKVLICTFGADVGLKQSGFFDRVLTLEDLFKL